MKKEDNNSHKTVLSDYINSPLLDRISFKKTIYLQNFIEFLQESIFENKNKIISFNIKPLENEIGEELYRHNEIHSFLILLSRVNIIKELVLPFEVSVINHDLQYKPLEVSNESKIYFAKHPVTFDIINLENFNKVTEGVLNFSNNNFSEYALNKVLSNSEKLQNEKELLYLKKDNCLTRTIGKKEQSIRFGKKAFEILIYFERDPSSITAKKLADHIFTTLRTIQSEIPKIRKKVERTFEGIEGRDFIVSGREGYRLGDKIKLIDKR